MDIKSKKKKLIGELIAENPECGAGMKIVSRCMLAVFFLRALLLVFEIIFFSASGLKVSIVSNLLFLPLIIILYMIFDGNRGIAMIPVISAVIRVAVYFSGGFKDVSAAAGGGAYTGIFLAVMLLQFAICLIVSYATRCQSYFKMMQAVNFRIQKEYLGGNNRHR